VTRTKKAALDRYEFGPDVITLEPCGSGEVGIGTCRENTTARVLVNGIHRANIGHPNGYGTRWTLHALYSLRHKDGWGGRRMEAMDVGPEGKRRLLEEMLADLHKQFPTQREVLAHHRCQEHREGEKRYLLVDPFGRGRTESEYVERRERRRREGMARIAAREVLEDHAQVMASIPAAGLSNRQAAALDDAKAQAQAAVVANHGAAEWARRKRDLQSIWDATQRGQTRWDALPSWWPLD
jgi:hypothetical protein